jgi:hypothetical protein
MILGIAGPVDLQQSAPNAAKQYPVIKHQVTAHHAYWKADLSGEEV